MLHHLGVIIFTQRCLGNVAVTNSSKPKLKTWVCGRFEADNTCNGS